MRGGGPFPAGRDSYWIPEQPDLVAVFADDGGPGSDGSNAPRDLAAPGGDLARTNDLSPIADLRSPPDLRTPPDLAPPPDLAIPPDLRTPPDLRMPPDLVSVGPINGGPCVSGAAGATAFRFKFINAGGQAQVSYEVNGLPDKQRWKAGAYGMGFGFTPMWVDPFLGAGGLQLDGSDFIDVELSTRGLGNIRSATLAIFGRSFNVNTSGSFNWMTFTGAGSTPLNYVSNVAPYKWYGGDATAAFAPGDGGVLLRIKAGGNSGSLVVNRVELCMDAN